MNTIRIALRGIAALAILTAGSTVLAATAKSEAQVRFEQERAACLSGQSHQDRATCLKEAGAAYAQARRGDNSNSTGIDYQANAVARCNAQTMPADRDACVLRMQGQGKVQGSVHGGGLIREIETIVK